MSLSVPKQTLELPNTLLGVSDMNALKQRTQIGSLAAAEMERIVVQYGDKLLRMCFLYLKDRELAEDAVQDTFIRIYKKYGTFGGESSEKTWVMRIAINVCKNYRRGSWFRRVSCEETLDQVPAIDTLEAKAESDALLGEIMKLKEKYKEVILLYYYQNLKSAEIAAVLSMPESTVSVRLMRAKEQLKDKLKGWYYND